MAEALTIPLLVLLIIGAAILLGVQRQRQLPKDTQGSKPGKGYHELESNYSSGLGGHSTSWKVPRDPQEYARRFVPRHKRSGTDS